ncbi:hypothetical protein BH09CHL1_BH09CHL1_36480 [soil metagenome]
MVDVLQPVWRLLRMTFVLTVFFSQAFSPLIGATATTENELDGRLGGSFASFVNSYGEPSGLNASIGEVFNVQGYGLVAAQFSRLAGPSDDDAPALLITLRSERDETVPATTPDEADWSIEDAHERVAAFAPADAALTEFVEESDGSLTATCTSAALSESFGQLASGGCSVRAVQSEPGKVSFITLSLVTSLVAEASATPVSDCQGAAEWAQGSGERMASAQELLGQLVEIDPATPSAGDDLASLEVAFAALASDQRAATAPAAAATANFYLIGAFSGYASAVANAAEGVAVSDQSAIDSAAKQIEAANTKIERAGIEIEKLAADCGLAVATPVATTIDRFH